MRRKMTCSTKNLDVFWPRTWPAGENPASYHMTRAAETAKTTEMMKRMKDIEKAELLLLVVLLIFVSQGTLQDSLHTLLFPKVSYLQLHLVTTYDAASEKNLSLTLHQYWYDIALCEKI